MKIKKMGRPLTGRSPKRNISVCVGADVLAKLKKKASLESVTLSRLIDHICGEAVK